MTAPVAPGWWWVARNTTPQHRSVVLVEGDYPTAAEQTVNYVGGGFSSVAKLKNQGFDFLQPVAAMEDGRHD
jgi:hypothetical protein